MPYRTALFLVPCSNRFQRAAVCLRSAVAKAASRRVDSILCVHMQPLRGSMAASGSGIPRLWIPSFTDRWTLGREYRHAPIIFCLDSHQTLLIHSLHQGAALARALASQIPWSLEQIRTNPLRGLGEFLAKLGRGRSRFHPHKMMSQSWPNQSSRLRQHGNFGIRHVA